MATLGCSSSGAFLVYSLPSSSFVCTLQVFPPAYVSSPLGIGGYYLDASALSFIDVSDIVFSLDSVFCASIVFVFYGSGGDLPTRRQQGCGPIC